MSVGPQQSPSEIRCRTAADELARVVPRFYDGDMLRGHKARVKALLGIPSDGTLYRVLQRATGQELEQAQSYARLLVPILGAIGSILVLFGATVVEALFAAATLGLGWIVMMAVRWAKG